MLAQETVLLVDDNNDVLNAYQSLLSAEGYRIKAINNPLDALEIIPENWKGVVVSDIYMPQLSGWELLSYLHQRDKHLPVILITGHGDVPMAIEAVQKGAFYFIEKPIKPEKLLIQIEQALAQRQRQLAIKNAQQETLETHFIGQSHWMKQFRQRLQQLGETSLPIFIFGEIGTGRTLAAQHLAGFSVDRFSPQHSLELLSPCDIEELQPHLDQAKQGLLQLKNIEYLSQSAQKRLALSIQQQHFRFIGISQYSPYQLLTEFGLLPELFYAFNLTQIECLPLSRRTSDIEPIFRHYLAQTCKKLNKKKPLVSESFIKQLISQQWLGNITQLIHTAELYAVGVTVQNDRLSLMQEQSELSLDNLIDEYEKQIIIEVLDRFQGRINEAANYLQIPRKKLYLRMKKYALNKADYKELF
ncbi:sigma-54 dependent transcriptional regulator [Rodentibacter sp. Ppn85]|uniref:sigma-54-dependent transcriptional regulator n=1 Tax=Rodentibacter sp. Ppn85 TaxID=1908525 RepID=UPI0009858FF9|nr:sigma-54 dependent transcriptional regulator [Rodentibacter sp. Ppn85]OOF60353.1 transcriptional regulator [Rodentibacter sp. Ppn85]